MTLRSGHGQAQLQGWGTHGAKPLEGQHVRMTPAASPDTIKLASHCILPACTAEVVGPLVLRQNQALCSILPLALPLKLSRPLQGISNTQSSAPRWGRTWSGQDAG